MVKTWDMEMVALPEGIAEEGIVVGCVRCFMYNFKTALELEAEGVTCGQGGMHTCVVLSKQAYIERL